MEQEGRTRGHFPRKLTENSWVLGCEAHPCYLVCGSREAVLVEGGVSAITPLVDKQLACMVEGALLSFLVATHSHADHSTGLMRLKKEKPGRRLCATAGTGRVLANEKILNRLLDEDELYSASLYKKGIVPENPGRLDVSGVALDRELKDGEVLDLGGVRVTILETPGHAPGALCAWVQPDRLLLISDAAGFADRPDNIYPMFFQDLDLYMASLDRLEKLAPEVVGLGHQIAIKGRDACRDYFQAAKKEAEFMAGDMKERELAGEPRDEVAEFWAERLRSFDFFAEFPQETLMGYTRLLCRRASGR